MGLVLAAHHRFDAPVGTHLFIGLFDEVGSADDIELVLRSLPPEAQARVPEMRVLAAATLAQLERAIEPASPLTSPGDTYRDVHPKTRGCPGEPEREHWW